MAFCLSMVRTKISANALTTRDAILETLASCWTVAFLLIHSL